MKSGISNESTVLRELKSILGHSMVYGVGNIASKVIGFIMIPIYTRYLTPADYGIVELIDLVLAVAGLILYDLIVEAIFRFYYKYDDLKSRNEVISSALVVHVVISLAVAGIALMLTDEIAEIVAGSREYRSFFYISFMSFIFMQAKSIPMCYLRVKQKSKMFVGVSIASLIIGLSLNIYLIVFLQMGVYGVLYSGLISNCIIAVILGVQAFNEVGINFSWHKVVAMFKFGGPMIPSGIGMFILNFSNRFFLSKYALLSDVGLYALGAKFGFMVHVLVIQPFLGSWDAKMFQIAKEKNAKDIYARALTYFLFIVVFFALSLSVLIKDVIKIITTPIFYDSYRVVPILCLGYFLMSFYYHFYVGILVREKTVFIGIVVGTTALLSLVLNWIFVPKMGIVGAAIAQMLSYLAMSCGAFYFSNRLYPIKYEWKRILKLSVTALLIYLSSTFIYTDSMIYSLSVRFALLITFPLALWFIGFYEKEEIMKAKESIKLLRAKWVS